MSLSSATVRAYSRVILSNILDMLEPQHTVSIEYTVTREKERRWSFSIEILFLSERDQE